MGDISILQPSSTQLKVLLIIFSKHSIDIIGLLNSAVRVTTQHILMYLLCKLLINFVQRVSQDIKRTSESAKNFEKIWEKSQPWYFFIRALIKSNFIIKAAHIQINFLSLKQEGSTGSILQKSEYFKLTVSFLALYCFCEIINLQLQLAERRILEIFGQLVSKARKLKSQTWKTADFGTHNKRQ